jgi:hypothetical protein
VARNIAKGDDGLACWRCYMARGEGSSGSRRQGRGKEPLGTKATHCYSESIVFDLRRRSLAGDVLRLRLERASPFRTSSCAPSPPYRQGTHVMRPCHGRRPLESVASQTSREHVRICRLTVHVQSGSSWRRGLRVFCTGPNGSGLHPF